MFNSRSWAAYDHLNWVSEIRTPRGVGIKEKSTAALYFSAYAPQGVRWMQGQVEKFGAKTQPVTARIQVHACTVLENN